MNNFMKKLLLFLLLLSGFAAAQVSYVSPQSVTVQNVFQSQQAAGTSGCIQNIGQTVHILTYTSNGTPNPLQIRLEYSFDSDAATCTTGTWFAMSDDASSAIQGEVVGLGAYPFIRANLVSCGGCGPGLTVTASYTGSSAVPGIPYGFYNPSQQYRKILFTAASVVSGDFVSVSVSAPYGSAAGFIVFHSINTLPANSLISVAVHVGNASNTPLNFTLPTSGLSGGIAIPVPSVPATSVDVTYLNGSGSTVTVNAYYYFVPPSDATVGNAQAPSTLNGESTSAANASVSRTLTISSKLQRAHLFSVSARCSAGTAQVTVSDGATQIYSSAATEVGTATNFNKSWIPSLSSTPGNSMTVTLGTCGVGNTGTLDVQGSVF